MAEINSLHALDKKIHQLQLRAKELEKEMDQRLDYLHDNYSSMMVKSFIPVFSGKAGIVGSLLNFVFQNRRLQDSFSKLAEQLFNKVSDGVEFIADKLERKEKNEG